MRKAFSIAVFAVFALASLAGRADTAYLYWQVNQDGVAEADKIQFEFARIAVLNSSDSTPVSGAGGYVYLADPSAADSTLYAYSSDGYNVSSVASLGDYNSSAYSFVVELTKYAFYSANDFDVVGRGEVMSYSDIQNHIAYGNMGLPAIEGAIASTSFTRVVPEPTSGMLFLVGGALLALRRKRRA